LQVGTAIVSDQTTSSQEPFFGEIFMASAIVQQVEALLLDQPISHPRATVDYIPKSHSKIPFNFAAVAWDVIDSPEYRQLSDGARVLYLYLCRHANLTLKQETHGNKDTC